MLPELPAIADRPARSLLGFLARLRLRTNGLAPMSVGLELPQKLQPGHFHVVHLKPSGLVVQLIVQLVYSAEEHLETQALGVRRAVVECH